MHYIVKLCNYCLCWSCSAGRLLPASAGSFAPAPAFASFGLFSCSPSCCLRWSWSPCAPHPHLFVGALYFSPLTYLGELGCVQKNKQIGFVCLFFCASPLRYHFALSPTRLKIFVPKTKSHPFCPLGLKIFLSPFSKIFLRVDFVLQKFTV